MKKLLLITLFLPVIAIGQKAFKTFDLPRIDGKVTYLGRASIKYNNFQRTVKSCLGQYTSYYNGLIEQESNKIKDYIVYEDSAVIVANMRFYARQMYRLSLFSAEVTYQKENERQYSITATHFKMLKIAQGFVGQINASTNLDDIITSKNPRLYSLMQEEVKKLFTIGRD